MIKSNIDDVIASLDKARKEIEVKLNRMVVTFCFKITESAIDNTPIGDSEKFSAMYNLPKRLDYLPAESGFAKGNWYVALANNSNFSGVLPRRATDETAQNVKSDEKVAINNLYKFGKTVYITNHLPYIANEGVWYKNFGSLEGGYSVQAPNGIMQPTMQDIVSVFSKAGQLKSYYERGM